MDLGPVGKDKPRRFLTVLVIEPSPILLGQDNIFFGLRYKVPDQRPKKILTLVPQKSDVKLVVD